MMARIGVTRALNRGHVREFNSSGKTHHWGVEKAQEGRMTVWVYVNTSKQVGDKEHLKDLCERESRRDMASGE